VSNVNLQAVHLSLKATGQIFSL